MLKCLLVDRRPGSCFPRCCWRSRWRRSLAAVNAAPNGGADPAAALADGERHADRVRLRQQHLGGRARRRRGAAPHQLSGPDDEPAVLARRQVDRVQRRVRRQPRRLRRAGRGRRAEAADLASRRRHRAGLDARRQGDRLRLRARHAGRRAARRAFWTVPATGGVEEPMALPRGYQGKISPDGTHIAYRMNNSWDDERRNYRGGQNRPIWIVDLKTYDLVSPPWTDSKDIDPVVGRRHGLLHLRPRRRRERLVVRARRRRSSRRSRSSPTST